MTTAASSATPTPSNVIAALAAVMTEVGGIAKTRGGDRDDGIKYAFRGIDAIAAAAQPLLGKYGVVIVPTSATITSIDPITVNNKPWTDTIVTVAWTVCGPGGVDDKIEAVTQGVGRDNSDKGYSKAATQAFKNLLLRLLCIGDPNDDTDGQTHERSDDVRPFDWPAIGWHDQAEHDVERARIRDAIGALDEHVRTVLLERWAAMGLAWPLSRDQVDEWELVAAEVIAQEADPADPET